MPDMKEPQYKICLDIRDRKGLAQFGLMSNVTWNEDPKRLAFQLARYKFVGKMLGGTEKVLEVGCADAFATRIVRQEVQALTAVDFDPVFIEDAQSRMDDRWNFDCLVHDMCRGPMAERFDAVYSLDVLEHILPQDEDRFLSNLCASLHPDGAAILGMPSIQSQAYASEPSKAGHVNCMDGNDFKKTMQRYFHNVFVFSMNDEVVHTGFYPMAHYLLALCCHVKETRE